jgi:Leucine-rich repeat (LRR) protein
MKKLILFTLVVFQMSSIKAQSLVISGGNYFMSHPDTSIEHNLDVMNVSNSAVNVVCQKTIISCSVSSNLSIGPYYSFAGSVYPSTSTSPSNAITIAAGQLISLNNVPPDFDGHTGYYYGWGYSGIAEVEYCFYDVNNPLDETCVLITYHFYLMGCTDSTSSNYDPNATIDDGSCCIDGCMDATANNYNPFATCDNGSCTYPCTYIPDDNFEAYLEANGMGNGVPNDDSVFTININTVTNLDLSSVGPFYDLTGIEGFIALEFLDCDANPLTSLNVSNNTALIELTCYGNLTSLNVSGAINLQKLDLDWPWGSPSNQLTSLDLSQNTALMVLSCGDRQLTSLNVSNNTALTSLSCGGNQLTSLDVSNNTALTSLSCGGNQLTSLDVSNNTALTNLYCTVNYIECLDISNNLVLTNLDCSNNLLEQLNTRNGNFQNMSVDALSNNLTCVEVDNIGVATNNWDFDSFTTISTNCNYTNPCNTSTSLQEQTTNKELLKVTDLLGRETKQTNQPLFYIYDDGTVEKRIVIE